MDVREFEFWSGEASRARIAREVSLMESVRLAMWAKGEDFAGYVGALRSQLMTAEERRRSVDNAWLRLRVVGRG